MENNKASLYAFVNCAQCGKENMVPLYHIENPIDEKHIFDLKRANVICDCGHIIQLKYLDNDSQKV